MKDVVHIIALKPRLLHELHARTVAFYIAHAHSSFHSSCHSLVEFESK